MTPTKLNNKKGTGSTGKKHEERESKKGNKTDNWKWGYW